MCAVIQTSQLRPQCIICISYLHQTHARWNDQ